MTEDMQRGRREWRATPYQDRWLSVSLLLLIGVGIYWLGVTWRETYSSPPRTAAADLLAVNPESPDSPLFMVSTPTPPAPTNPPTATLEPSPEPSGEPTPEPTSTPAPPVEVAQAPTTTPHFGPVLTAIPTATPRPPASPPPPGAATETALVPGGGVTGEVIPEEGLRLRAGPNTTFTALSLLARGTTVPVVARTGDDAWLRVVYQGQEGWVAAEYLRLTGALNGVPVESASGDVEARPCISVVGDSVPYGEVIFELPLVGFIKVKMAPFTEYIARQLTLNSVHGLAVTDRSYPGVGISSPVHTSYYTIPAFRDLMADRCRYTVILPWINDLSSGLDPALSAVQHAARLADLARRLVNNNPQGRVLIANYYPGDPAPFSQNMAYGFTPQAIALFNAAMAESCASGELAEIPQVLCIDSNAAFAELGTSYVVGPMTVEEVTAIQTRPLSPEEQEMLDYYIRTTPDGPLIGDGIHLSSFGKTVLASYIINLLLAPGDLTDLATPAG